jgi:hypothetical protein
MQERDEENCPATAIFIPTPVWSGSGSMGMLSVFCKTPLKDFGTKIMILWIHSFTT